MARRWGSDAGDCNSMVADWLSLFWGSGGAGFFRLDSNVLSFELAGKSFGGRQCLELRHAARWTSELDTHDTTLPRGRDTLPMNHFWESVSTSLGRQPTVLITLVECQGSTPRRPGARMAVGADGTLIGTIGGGAAEGKCLDACHAVLREQCARSLEIDLRGNPDAIRDGICGGTMRLLLTPLSTGDADLATHIAQTLRSGQRLTLCTCLETPYLRIKADGQPLKSDWEWGETLCPEPVLLIAGAGHIGRVLAHRAAEVGFQCMVQDERPQWLCPEAFPVHTRLSSDWAAVLDEFLAWQGQAYTALVTRGFKQDLEALCALAPHFESLAYLGVLGSERRLETVRSLCAARGLPEWPTEITHAPIGIDIGGETPEEIAISILAEMIRKRRRSAATHRSLCP